MKDIETIRKLENLLSTKLIERNVANFRNVSGGYTLNAEGEVSFLSLWGLLRHNSHRFEKAMI